MALAENNLHLSEASTHVTIQPLEPTDPLYARAKEYASSTTTIYNLVLCHSLIYQTQIDTTVK